MATMLEFLMLLHFLSLCLLCCVTSSSSFFTENNYVACRHDQIQALTQFKNEFDTSSCNQTAPFNGVWCDNSTGAVTKLQLQACLSGTLMPNSSLFKLHHLRYLNLSNNNFISSSLPSEFGNLNRLEILSLTSNGFLGQVPSSFSNLSQLYLLDLYQNELTGSFSHVQNLTKLSSLRLSYNHFSGTFSPFCELHHLKNLKLDHNHFSSSLPFRIGNLNKLEILSLASNGFFDQVPPTISNLTLLTKLSLGQNKLTGSLPLVQNLTKLSFVDLSGNHFTGTIFPLVNMPFLSDLDLSTNSLVGSIEVPNSSRLERMYLAYNHFERQILEPISKLINLTHLDISYLNISHPIDLNLFSSFKSLFFFDISGNSISPASLSSDSYKPLNVEVLYLSDCGITEFPNILKTVENLKSIRLSFNGIKGKVPKWFWSLPYLSSVNIANNFFNGLEGSSEILVNSSVQLLFMNNNNFEGELPNLPLSIRVFSVGANSFTGKIPLSICNRILLNVVDLKQNNFTGPIPQCVGNFMFANLRKNNLEGSIPDVFAVGASLRTLDLGFNRITGELPRSLLNCSSLRVLTIDHNRLKDTFPFWLKVLPNLQVLILRSNNFYGPISPPRQSPLGFPALQIFELSDNNFSGSLPPRYFVNWKASSFTMNKNGDLYMMYERDLSGLLAYLFLDIIDLQYKSLSMEQERVLTSYAAIDFSGNRIEGQIPESIGLLKGLIALNLSNNAFTGHIPMSLENLTELESLDLSRNQLSGNIPNGLSTLSFLAVINVSNNQLIGEIPQGPQITGQPKSSFEGNAWLCGLPLEKRCFGTIIPPIQQPEEEDEAQNEILNGKAVAIGYGLGVLFGLAIAQVIVSYKLDRLAKITGLTKRKNR